VALTKDHKPTDPDEIEMIKGKGGILIGHKVGGMLAVSRAFGDSELKRWVSVEPYQQETLLLETDTHLIVACDGLWDVCDNQQAVNVIKGETDAQVMSQQLLTYAMVHDTTDNVSVVVIVL